MKAIFMSNLEEQLAFTFKLYDFDNDEYITKEDLRLFLSYIPTEEVNNASSRNLSSKGVMMF